MATEPLSIRLDIGTDKTLRNKAQQLGLKKSALAASLIEEGLNTRDHAGILFRDGPAGRRAALAGGPDVWEVISALSKVDAKGERAIASTAQWLELSEHSVRSAIAYYVGHRDEIDDWIAEVERSFDEGMDRAQRAEQLISGE